MMEYSDHVREAIGVLDGAWTVGRQRLATPDSVEIFGTAGDALSAGEYRA